MSAATSDTRHWSACAANTHAYAMGTIDQMRSVHEYSRVTTDASQQAAVTPPHIHRLMAREVMARTYRTHTSLLVGSGVAEQVLHSRPLARRPLPGMLVGGHQHDTPEEDPREGQTGSSYEAQ